MYLTFWCMQYVSDEKLYGITARDLLHYFSTSYELLLEDFVAVEVPARPLQLPLLLQQKPNMS